MVNMVVRVLFLSILKVIPEKKIHIFIIKKIRHIFLREFLLVQNRAFFYVFGGQIVPKYDGDKEKVEEEDGGDDTKLSSST